METRKVQVTGKSTYVVSLPKKWVVKVNIKNGDSIALLPMPDGTLLINPNIKNKDKEQIRKIIQVGDDIGEMHRCLVASYLAGYNIFEFRSRLPIDKEVKASVRKICKSIIGPEIIEENDNSILVRNLLDSSDFTFTKGIRRMHSIARDMHQMAIDAIGSGRRDLADEVRQRDDEVDKLYWMIVKQYNLVLTDLSFCDKMGIRPQEALGFLLVARTLERIADHATRMAANYQILGSGKDIVEGLKKASEKVLLLLDESMNAFQKGRFDQAYGIINSGHKMFGITENLIKEAVAMKVVSEVSIPLTFIIDSLERTRAYSVDIAEIAINHVCAMKYNEELMNRSLATIERKEHA